MDLMKVVVRFGDFERAKLLIEKGADVNYIDNNRWTSLVWAVYYDRIEIGRLLIDCGADVNYTDGRRWNPLMYAVIYHRIEFIKLLLSRGANPNHKDCFGHTPLQIAFNCTTDKNIIANILRWRGAKTKLFRDIDGLILFIYYKILPLDLIREIHTKWV
jgi:ankyrin repeat protein